MKPGDGYVPEFFLMPFLVSNDLIMGKVEVGYSSLGKF